MTNQELIDFKKKIAALPAEKKRERDLYLRDLALGRIKGEKTGYASVDKPWLKYYDNTLFDPKNHMKTVYTEIYDNNKDNLNSKALEFFGTKITYKKLFKNIDKAAKALADNGVKEGDFVTICSAGLPEIVYTFYAISKIGAVANFMSPYFDKNDMVDRINDCDSKMMIVMEDFYNAIKEPIKKSSIEKTIVVPTLNSSILRLMPTKNKPYLLEDDNVINWNTFIRKSKNKEVPRTVDYELLKPLCMVYSSGTTGSSKAILLSNDSFQNSIHAYPITGLNVEAGQKFYQIIPPWYSTGLSTSIHLPLSYSASVFMDPRFDRKVFVNNIIRKKFDATVAATTMYEGFQDESIVKGRKITNLSNAFQGGERLDINKKRSIEKVWHEHGCASNLKIGYGECECGAGIATQTDDVCDTPDTVGIPLAGITIGIFDDNKNEVKYFERGEILVDTPCGMIEYYKNEEATNKFFYIDEAGKKWSCTGDMGYMTDEGELVVLGRKSDYSIINGRKVYNFDIENIISDYNEIKNCEVFGIEKAGANELIANIIYNDEVEKKVTEDPEYAYETFLKIQKDVYEKYHDENMIPQYFRIWHAFPAAKSGKRDMQKMRENVDDAIFIDKSKLLDNAKKVKIK